MIVHATEEIDDYGSEPVASDRTGLLIIRAWLEKGSSEPLRAQIQVTTDVSAGIERTVTLSHADEVCATVQVWLTEVLSHADR